MKKFGSLANVGCFDVGLTELNCERELYPRFFLLLYPWYFILSALDVGLFYLSLLLSLFLSPWLSCQVVTCHLSSLKLETRNFKVPRKDDTPYYQVPHLKDETHTGISGKENRR